MTILKIIFLFLAVWFTIINVVRVANKTGVPFFNMFVQAIGIVGFVVIQFDLVS